MPLHRLANFNVLGASRNAGVKFRTGHYIRWQSSGPRGKSGGVLKKTVIGVGLTGVAAGGVLVYGNYNPVFKNQVNEIIPGFASWTDKAADMWVDVTDYFNPKPEGSKKKDGRLVYEYSEAKKRQEALKKSQSSPGAPAKAKPVTSAPDKKEESKGSKGEQKKGGLKLEDKSPGSPKEPEVVAARDKSKSKGDSAKSKSVPEDKAKVPVAENKLKVNGEEKSKSGVSKAEDKAKKDEVEVPKAKKDDVEVPKMEDKSKVEVSKAEEKSKAEVPTEVGSVEAKAESREAVTDTVTKTAPIEKVDIHTPPSPPPLPSAAPEVTSSPESKDAGDVARIEAEIEQEVSAIESGVDSAQVEVMLDDTYKRFVLDASKVRGAQQVLNRAWEDMYHKLTASYSEDGHRDKAVAEAKGAISVAHKELMEAARDYDRTSHKLKELLRGAPAKGFMAKTEDIASDMKVKEAEVDLGLVVVKEAITSATVVDGYNDAIKESRDQLQKDLDAASSLINPERRDSLLLSLNKKVELLDRKLQEAETEHARKLALALEAQRRGLEELAEEKVEHVKKEGEAKYQSELVKKANEISTRYNGILREQLRLENESHVNEVSEALKEQAKELEAEWSAEVDLKLSQQRGFYQVELARAKARLGAVEAMANGIASAGEKTLQLQALRNSCSSLAGTLDRLNLDFDVTKRYSIAAEITALRDAAEKDAFITAILNSIPSQAVCGEGMQSESILKERFIKVRQICKRVAMVPETGGGLGTYAISYLQSFFTIHYWLPKDTSADADLSELHVYNLLHLADTQLRKGDLEGAVHYMNHLKGEAKNVAQDWLKDARIYLETKQAIQLVQAYVAANAAVFNK